MNVLSNSAWMNFDNVRKFQQNSSYRVSQNFPPIKKGHCSLDIEAMILLSISLKGGHVQIYFNIYRTKIRHFTVKLLEVFSRKPLHDASKRSLESRPNLEASRPNILGPVTLAMGINFHLFGRRIESNLDPS